MSENFSDNADAEKLLKELRIEEKIEIPIDFKQNLRREFLNEAAQKIVVKRPLLGKWKFAFVTLGTFALLGLAFLALTKNLTNEGVRFGGPEKNAANIEPAESVQTSAPAVEPVPEEDGSFKANDREAGSVTTKEANAVRSKRVIDTTNDAEETLDHMEENVAPEEDTSLLRAAYREETLPNAAIEEVEIEAFDEKVGYVALPVHAPPVTYELDFADDINPVERNLIEINYVLPLFSRYQGAGSKFAFHVEKRETTIIVRMFYENWQGNSMTDTRYYKSTTYGSSD